MFSMHYNRYCMLGLIALTIVLSGAIVPARAATERVGVAAAVNPATTGTPPGGADRVVVVGARMVQNERVVTSDKGRTQLLFLDGSALTIGPNSDVVLDEFIYDPKTKIGKLAFSATKGLFRLVGGKISKKTPVLFKTPTAVIGIRGGIGIITVREVGKQAGLSNGLSAGQGASSASSAGVLRLAQATPGPRVITTAQLAFGQMTVQAGGVTRSITIPGFQVVATSPTAPPSQPTQAEAPGESLGGLEGSGGDNTGGALEAPTNEDVADTQISDLGSNIQPTLIVSAPPINQAAPPLAPLASFSDSAPLRNLITNIREDTIIVTLEETEETEETVVVADPVPPSIDVGGRFLSQTPFTSFVVDTGKTTRVALRNKNFQGAFTLDGFISNVVDGFDSDASSASNFLFRLPLGTGTFSVNSATALTNFGAVSGTGFGAPNETFFYWNLREVGANNNPASVFAGKAFTGTFPTTGFAAHDLFVGFPNLTSIPMLPVNYGGNFGGGPNAILYSAYSPNLLTFPNDGRSVALYGSIAIDGVGSSQKSAQIVYMGVYFGDSLSGDKLVLSGFARGSVRLTSTGRPIRVDGGGAATSRDGDNNSFFGTSAPDYFVISSDFTSTNTTLVDTAGFVVELENTSTPTTTFFHETYTQPKPLPSGVGTTRTTQSLNGYISGIAVQKTGSSTFTNYIVKTLDDKPDNFQINTNASTNRLDASISTADVFATQPALVIPLGNPTGSSLSRQAFIDDNLFGVRDSTSSTPTIGGNEGTSRIVLITSAFTNLSGSLVSGVTFCDCKFTKWGFISGEVRQADFSQRQRLHLVPWVAGVRSTAADITTAATVRTGITTYTGHVVANIKDGSNQFVAFGNYSQTWNFTENTVSGVASRQGSVTISDLDGATYTGSVSAVTSPDTQGREFVGSISGAGRSGTIEGTFMRGASDNVGEVGSQFHVVTTGYDAAGVALGKAN